MSDIFFEELGLPPPAVKLGIGSGSNSWQIGETILRLEKALHGLHVGVVIVPGDTNSALAGALTAVKMGIPVAHVEAGARSHDMTMSEEVNRRLIDHCSRLLFAPTQGCLENLKRESVPGETFLPGDTMFDAFLRFTPTARKNDILVKLGLTNQDYALVTVHRAENVDDAARLKNVVCAISKLGLQAVLPLHPRTKRRLSELKVELPKGVQLKVIKPVGYLEMLKLLKHARVVLTDSGGLQKEAFWSGVPCVTLRENTEWVETVRAGVNFLTGTDKRKIIEASKRIDTSYREISRGFSVNPFGDGHAAERIVKVLSDADFSPWNTVK
jgi:UDP-N-acetylglucosamine 2-epimerase